MTNSQMYDMGSYQIILTIRQFKSPIILHRSAHMWLS
ncbi:hypothetical protein BCPG3_076 [Bacillus phage BCPG3]|nr:hypothetical protein BCPG3_076 [Bacillus phage BCPG3]